MNNDELLTMTISMLTDQCKLTKTLPMQIITMAARVSVPMVK